MMEEALIRLCGIYGVRAGRIAGLTGVWCGLADGLWSKAPAGRKIGAIGIHVSRGITSHGFAFNVTTDLSYFQLINPCGITDRPSPVSRKRYLTPPPCPASNPSPTRRHVSSARSSTSRFSPSRASISCAHKHSSALQPPAEDTPLQVPAEVERLHGDPSRPFAPDRRTATKFRDL